MIKFDGKKTGIFAAGVAFGTAGIKYFYQARMLSVLIHSVQQLRFVLRIV